MNTFRTESVEMAKKKNKKLDVEKYNNWFSHLESTKDRTNYAVRRMDLMTISISGAGIYVVFETLKFFKEPGNILEHPILLAASGIFLLVSICVNFLAQITGYYANNYEEKYIYEVLEELQGKEFDKCAMEEYDRKVSRFNKATDIFNVASMVSMFIGLIGLFILYYLLLF